MSAEIERKYLIEMPDVNALAHLAGCEIWQITQTYLFSPEKGFSRRVRKIVSNGRTIYVRTFKRRVSALTCMEDEAEISESEYLDYLKEADTEKETIEKTRCRLPHENHIVEIDIYPFWTNKAIMEIELSNESETTPLPVFIHVIRDVTEDVRYKNTNLAKPSNRRTL